MNRRDKVERNSYKMYAQPLTNHSSDDEIRYKNICEEVGSDISDLLDSYDRLEITKQFAEADGISLQLARVTIGDYTKGEFWRNISPTRKAQVDRHLRRLSNFYSVIGLEEESDLVTKIKEVNSNFVYPL